MATIKERLDLLDAMHKEERDVMERKANDYAAAEDCNKNIMACEIVGIATAEQGIFIRMFDKMSRMINLVLQNKESKVKDESIKDTIHDLRNYLAILWHVHSTRKG